MNQEELERYNRHIRLPEIGLQGQKLLKQARVAVIGAGGLGCPVLQYLTAAGVGTIGIIDGDTVSLSNLQRQILFSPEHIGQSKAETAAHVLRQQNPHIEVIAHPVFLNAANALTLLGNYDIIVDGSDNFATRYLVNDACVLLNNPLVFGSIFKFEGQVSVFNYRGGPTYRCLYPEPSELEACSVVGVLGVLPGITGCLMANEVIKLITNIGESLSGTLLCFNTLQFSFSTFSFELNPENLRITALQDASQICEAVISELTVSEFWQWMNQDDKPFLLDVREAEEYEQDNLGGALIPLAELPVRYHELPAHQTIIVHCQSGIRSKKAVQLLQEKGFTQVHHLSGGLYAIRQLQL
ncbi:molybdopterin-synthase adenylyltransferase MoeB [Siphonobacter sp. SORGH_AS_1065]|uniref:molybdopterin-synthase adenylyltransferase MoeB n=1 Tax=Siphonobacter sp. SORGH_AS_1065 TaxID=3041795 RepID=UPI002789A2DE|nr:molybdopterin-synthase adenylyltransferase MoeB [Siphonobacter sp. SORGH_AS_1065]MDQ1089513.1 molybdopterin/thiamine biosynthesis adenylyltransferase/rhodanese-related sulfurtransferase [Siphonobacter sp. SORGH_AS_1065]